MQQGDSIDLSIAYSYKSSCNLAFVDPESKSIVHVSHHGSPFPVHSTKRMGHLSAMEFQVAVGPRTLQGIECIRVNIHDHRMNTWSHMITFCQYKLSPVCTYGFQTYLNNKVSYYLPLWGCSCYFDSNPSPMLRRAGGT